MKKDTEQTVVIFRKWNKSFDNGQSIIALFPYINGSMNYVMSYEHIDQHGDADYHYVVSNSKLAKPEEYADLKKELEDIGYNLKIAKKKQYNRVKKAIDKIMGIC
jgi:hypothetical protein